MADAHSVEKISDLEPTKSYIHLLVGSFVIEIDPRPGKYYCLGHIFALKRGSEVKLSGMVCDLQ